MEDFFDRVYVLNLKRRPDRLSQFYKRLGSVHWPFKHPVPFDATDGKETLPPKWFTQGKGAWGCLFSHVRMLDAVLSDGLKSVLILEDDCVFSPTWNERIEHFIGRVPSDWDHLYLGCQHLLDPTYLDGVVVRGHNCNRTHAHALRGEYIRTAYHHVLDWEDHQKNLRHHVDHRFGVLHKTGKYHVYAPQDPLIGQDTSKSDVGNARKKDQFWARKPMAARKGQKRPSRMPKRMVAVLGPPRSGTSMMTGILKELGCCMGHTWQRGADKNNPKGFFEAKRIYQMCRDFYTEPGCEEKVPYKERVEKLKKWKNGMSSDPSIVVGAKHPLLCMMVPDLMEAWGPHLMYIVMDRDEKAIHKSLETAGWWPRWYKEFVECLTDTRDEALDRIDPRHVCRFTYEEVVSSPEKTVDRLLSVLDVSVPEKQRQKAIDFVDPKLNRSSS